MTQTRIAIFIPESQDNKSIASTAQNWVSKFIGRFRIQRGMGDGDGDGDGKENLFQSKQWKGEIWKVRRNKRQQRVLFNLIMPFYK